MAVPGRPDLSYIYICLLPCRFPPRFVFITYVTLAVILGWLVAKLPSGGYRKGQVAAIAAVIMLGCLDDHPAGTAPNRKKSADLHCFSIIHNDSYWTHGLHAVLRTMYASNAPHSTAPHRTK